MNKKRITILGGGYAGVHAAKRLYKAFKRHKDQVEITLIDKHREHILMTELHEIAGNRVGEESVKISFDRIFSGTSVQVIRDEIVDIDFESQNLHGTLGQYGYDYLLISTGAEATDFNIPGVKEHAFYLWSIEDAIKIRNHIEETVKAASRELDPEKRAELLTFVVAGGGFTGVELVGELTEWLPTLCRENGVDYDEVTLMLIEALGSILNMIPEGPRQKAVTYMQKKGVEIHYNSLITQVDADGFSVRDGRRIETKTLVWTCGIRGTTFCSQLPLTDGKVGRKRVNEFMQSLDYENVYLAGDGIWFMEDAKPLPQTVEAAEQTAATAAAGIAYAMREELGLKNKKRVKPFKSNFHGYMVSVGGRYAVSHNMGISMSGFFAQALKHLVNIYYQVGVCGLNAAWAYLKHEIFEIRDQRSLIGGLAANKVPAYWTAFLRVFLGVMWLIEGINKITGGWLADKTGSKVYWGAPAEGVSSATQAVAEATSSATEAVVETVATATQAVVETVASASQVTTEAVASASQAVAEVVTSASQAVVNTVASASQAVVDTVTSASQAGDAVAAAAQQFAPPLLSQPLAIYTWLSETFVASAPYFFQVMIVVAEVGMGLCFIAGLFTFPAAIASIGLSIMLLIGAMAGKEILWYMAVSIVMLGGAGKAFGLDYWVMPYLKGIWNKTTLAKKSYLYLDEPGFTKKQLAKREKRRKDALV